MLFFKKVKIWKYSFHIKILSAKLFTSLLNNKSKNNYWEFSPLFAKESSLEEKMGNANNRITASDFFWGLFCILIYFNPTLVSLHNKLISKSKFFYLRIRQKKLPTSTTKLVAEAGSFFIFISIKLYFFKRSTSRAIMTSSSVGMTKTGTLESSAEITPSPPR